MTAPLDQAREWLVARTHGAFEHARAQLHVNPVRRAVLDDGELVALGGIDELFDWFTHLLHGDANMANQQQTPPNQAGQPTGAQHPAAQAAQAAGAPPDIAARVGAAGGTVAGFDINFWVKLAQQFGPVVWQIISVILAGGAAPGQATPPRP